MVKAILALALLIPAAQEPQTFSVSGTVKFDGPPPKPKPNKALAGDPACAACHAVTPPKDDLVVSKEGGVRWAFVYVKKGLEGKTFEPPAKAVLIDQVGCLYTPHVAGVMVGQTVNFKNSDPFGHNVHGLPFINREFNFAESPGAVMAVRFTAAEVMVRVKCDIHPWMATWIGVLDHPFFAVTDAEGKFEIKDLPPGTYTLGVWHEGLQTPDRKNEVEIVVKGAGKVDFVMQPKKAP